MRIAYIDCIGGLAGDMFLGALLDAGLDREALVAGLRTLSLPVWELTTSRVQRSGIAAIHVDVVVGGQSAGAAPLLGVSAPPDAPGNTDPAHSHGSHLHSHSPAHSHSHSGSHTHSHDHVSSGGTRTFLEVEALIEMSDLPEAVKTRGLTVFRRLGEAEARVHGTTLEEIHFHEVGAVDSIVDVLGGVLGLHLLGVEQVVCSDLPVGHGTVRCAHGRMPNPPPATAELLKGVPLRPVDLAAELVTPTGAALAAGLSSHFGHLPAMRIEQVGYGAGTREFSIPNLTRVLIGQADEPVIGQAKGTEPRTVVQMEANIDDMSPQFFESVLAALLAAGALDVWITPILMKRGRPAQQLSVLCAPDQREALAAEIFRQTTTLGLRYTTWERDCLDRRWETVDTPWGPIRIKLGLREGQVVTAMPEFADCLAAATRTGVPVREIQAAAHAAGREWLGNGRS